MAVRVTFLASRLVREGPITQLVALLGRLPALGVDCSVLLIRDEGPEGGAMLDPVADLGVPVHSASADGPALFGRAIRRCWSDDPGAVVTSLGVRADLLNAVFGPRGRRVAIKHEAAYSPWGGSRMRTLALRSTHLRILRGMDHLVAVSDHVRGSLPTVLRGRTTVIRNGVDLDHFRPPTAFERRKARASLGATEGELLLMFMGRLVHGKRVRLLFEPIRRLQAEGLPVRLVILGDGPLRRDLERQSAGLPVSFLGFAENVRDLLWGVDSLSLLSTHEGMPMAVAEALACGIPVVLSDIPSHREVLTEDSRSGMICDPTRPDETADALRKCLVRGLNAAPRALAESRLGSGAMARAYATFFKGLI